MPPTQSLSRRSERSVRTSGVLADTTATVDGTALAERARSPRGLAAGLDPGGYLLSLEHDAVADAHVEGLVAASPVVRSYAHVEPGTRVATVGSHGNVELAVNRGRGDEAFDVGVGDGVVLEWD